jgi:hypothetical protein
MVTCIVARGENTIDDIVFNDPEAGSLLDIHLPHKTPE